MSRVAIFIKQDRDGYAAVIGLSARFSPTLDGFGSSLEEQLRTNRGPNTEIDFILSRELRAKFEPCLTCRGGGHVEIESPVGAQFLAGPAGSLDFSRRVRTECPTCHGIGVDIPGFWKSSTSAS